MIYFQLIETSIMYERRNLDIEIIPYKETWYDIRFDVLSTKQHEQKGACGAF